MNNEFYKYSKLCWFYKIFIYPIPTSKRDVYKIQVDFKGKKRTGQLEFENKPSKNNISVWNKILELYKYYYEKEINKD